MICDSIGRVGNTHHDKTPVVLPCDCWLSLAEDRKRSKQKRGKKQDTNKIDHINVNMQIKSRRTLKLYLVGWIQGFRECLQSKFFTVCFSTACQTSRGDPMALRQMEAPARRKTPLKLPQQSLGSRACRSLGSNPMPLNNK